MQITPHDSPETLVIARKLFIARIASAVLAIAIPSVCPSVCQTPVLRQNDCT